MRESWLVGQTSNRIVNLYETCQKKRIQQKQHTFTRTLAVAWSERNKWQALQSKKFYFASWSVLPLRVHKHCDFTNYAIRYNGVCGNCCVSIVCLNVADKLFLDICLFHWNFNYHSLWIFMLLFTLLIKQMHDLQASLSISIFHTRTKLLNLFRKIYNSTQTVL
jgi:hypothetical protein